MTEEAVQPMGFGKRLLGVFFSPVETFRDIAERPKFLVILLLQVGLSLFLKLLLKDKLLELARANAEKMGQPFYPTATLVFILIGVAVSLPIGILILSGLLKLYGQFTLGEGSFKAVFSVITWAELPTMLGEIIRSVLSMFASAQDMMRINTSLALFYSGGSSTSFLYMLLSMFDLFTIWSLLLMAIGGGFVLKQSPKKVGAFLFVLWLVYAIGISAVGSIFGGQAGMG